MTGDNQPESSYILLLLLDDSFDKIWSDRQCANVGMETMGLEDCKAACRMKSDCTAVNFCPNANKNSCVFRACSNPIPAPTIYNADCRGHLPGSGKLLEVMNINYIKDKLGLSCVKLRAS